MLTLTKKQQNQLVQKKNAPPAKQKKKKNKRHGKTGKVSFSRSLAGDYLTRAYLDTLTDPFTYPGVKLGWGTLIPTSLGTAYFRGTGTANADGSCYIVAMPNVKNLALFGTAGIGSALFGGGATVIDGQDIANVQSNFGVGRCVSLGLKSYPLLAATVSPGILYSGAGTFPYENMATITDTDALAFPTTIQSRGYDGGFTVGHPIDPVSFMFSESVVDGTGWQTGLFDETNYTNNIPFSIPYHCYRGLVAGTTVSFEVTMNFEGYTQLKHSTSSAIPGTYGPSLADNWPSVESLWNGIRGYLPAPSHPGITAALHGLASGVAKAAGSAIGGYLSGGSMLSLKAPASAAIALAYRPGISGLLM